ncbi:MAG: DUF4355 domain-containing protein [Lachnospiraceae bacterium]|nr:DUF4355 domain-containing protein [Lachnospiraceae bacterium]
MNFEEVKAFLESTEGKTKEVTDYLQNIVPVSVARIEDFVSTSDGKSWLDSAKDKHLQKGLETWKTNHLEEVLDAEVKKRFPEKDPKDIEMEKLKNEIAQMKQSREKEALTNKAMKLANEKGLPLDLVGFFIGADEESTISNLKALEDTFNISVQKGLEERLKTNSYTPPTGGEAVKSLEDVSMDEYIKLRQRG